MVHLKFGPVEIAMHCQTAFDELFQDEWIEDEPVFLDLIRTVDKSEWLGGGLLRNLETNKRYNFTGLCGGTKLVISSAMLEQYWWNIKHMGANVYPFMAEIQDKYEIHLVGDMDPFFYAGFGPYNCPDIFLDDYGVLTTCSEELKPYLDKWQFEHGILQKKDVRYHPELLDRWK